MAAAEVKDSRLAAAAMALTQRAGFDLLRPVSITPAHGATATRLV
jgi:hypothetical protein